jgi:hypothetical protein
MIEFQVEIVDREGEKVAVAGRLLQGPIRIGDEFTLAYQFANVMKEDFRHVNEVPVSLRIDTIVAYRRELPDLYDGMTARLTLSGEGGRVLSRGWVLGG